LQNWGWIDNPDLRIQVSSCDFISPDDGLCVGSDNGSKLIIFKWNGEEWKLADRPDQISDHLNSVQRLSSNNVWISGDQSYLVHWDGEVWKYFSISPSWFDLGAMSFFSSNLGFLTGSDHLNKPYERRLWKWDGKAWNQVPFPRYDDPNSYQDINAILLVTDKEGWAGDYFHLYHWDGVTWKVYPIKDEVGNDYSGVSAFSEVTPGDIWALGQMYSKPDNTSYEVIIHWDGRSWKEIYRTQNQLKSIRMFSQTQGLVVGQTQSWVQGADNTMGFILNWDGKQWSEIYQTPRFPLSAVCGYDLDHAWVNGTKLLPGENDYTFQTVYRTLHLVRNPTPTLSATPSLIPKSLLLSPPIVKVITRTPEQIGIYNKNHDIQSSNKMPVFNINIVPVGIIILLVLLTILILVMVRK
jgi:hypothetical protein